MCAAFSMLCLVEYFIMSACCKKVRCELTPWGAPCRSLGRLTLVISSGVLLSLSYNLLDVRFPNEDDFFPMDDLSGELASDVPADVLAPNGARTSAGTMLDLIGGKFRVKVSSVISDSLGLLRDRWLHVVRAEDSCLILWEREMDLRGERIQGSSRRLAVLAWISYSWFRIIRCSCSHRLSRTRWARSKIWLTNCKARSSRAFRSRVCKRSLTSSSVKMSPNRDSSKRWEASCIGLAMMSVGFSSMFSAMEMSISMTTSHVLISFIADRDEGVDPHTGEDTT